MSPAQAADWPRLAGAPGRLRRALALRAASGAPAGRGLSRLAFDRFRPAQVPGCDKNMPGCLMAMARVNRPSVMVYGGTIRAGNPNPNPNPNPDRNPDPDPTAAPSAPVSDGTLTLTVTLIIRAGALLLSALLLP